MPRSRPSRAELEQTVQQSLLDRLIDLSPHERSEPAVTWAQSVRDLKRSVHRDLESLLNTRRTPNAATDASPELKASLYNYGLPDISSMSRDAHDSRTRLLRLVEDAISVFEPRLANVRASFVEEPGGSATRRDLHFVDPRAVAHGSQSRTGVVRYDARRLERRVSGDGRRRCVTSCSTTTSAS